MERATFSALTVKGNGRTVSIAAIWQATKACPAGEHTVVFDRERLLGATATKPPLKQRLAKPICRLAQDIILEILQAKGVR
jgi:hypothetical protein